MSYPLESAKVFASVRTIGVMQPILVNDRACEKSYQIIAGFRRAHACRKMDIEMVNVQIYPIDPADTLPAFSLALYENLSHRNFNDVEKALILSKLLQEFQCRREDVIHTYMPLLELAPHEKVLATYLHLWQFEAQIKRYIADHAFPMTVYELLATLSVEDRQAVFEIISSLKPGVNKLKELLNFLDEIARRDHCPMHRILADPSIREIVEHEKYTAPQKITRLRRIIREKRYPQLTTLEHNYQAGIKRLNVPQGLHIQADPSFERDDLNVTFRFRSPGQLKTIADELLILSQQTGLQHVLDIIQGNERI